jgi:AbrB family looped-hinge helix DNA binding protein
MVGIEYHHDGDLVAQGVVTMPTHVRIDRQGRVVIPQRERDRLGLEAGSTLELVATPEGLLLERRRTAEVRQGADGAPLVQLADQAQVSNQAAQQAIDEARTGR